MVEIVYCSTQGFCASRCFAHMLGNGLCDSACLNTACENDKGDCVESLCSKDCYPYMLGDRFCDENCNVIECDWDGGDCECAPGCFAALLDNGECDEMCDTEGCGFDGGACVRGMQGSCAQGCFEGMVGDGHCDSVCNLAACNWDSFDCGCAPGCDFSEIGHCKSECLVPECDYDMIPQSDIVTLTCANATCFSEDQFSSLCVHPMTCSEFQFSVRMNCCEDCCLGGYSAYELNPILCVRYPDKSSRSSPYFVYVDSESGEIEESGNLTHPLHSLTSALLRLYEKVTVIVLAPGEHFIEASGSVIINGAPDFSQDYPTTYPVLSQLTITSLDCLENSTDCTRAVLVQNSTKHPFVNFPGIRLLEITNVDIESYLPLTLCMSFIRCGPNDDFFSVGSNSTLRFENVTFRHFRQAVSSLIRVENSSLELFNVNFEDVMVRFMGYYQGLILSSSYANITYIGGRVTLLNNGYNYASRMHTYGFLWVQLADILIDGVEFSYNFIDSLESSDTPGFSSLFSIQTCYTCIIRNSVFQHNIGYDGGILHLVGSGLNFLFNTSESAEKLIASRVEIDNCVFRNNTGNRGSAILLEFQHFFQYVVIRNCTFINEFSMSYGIVSAEGKRTGLPGSRDFSRNITNSKGRVFTVTYPAKVVELQNLTFVNCTATKYGLIFAYNIPAIHINTLTIQSRDNYLGVDSFSTTFHAFMLLPGVHIPEGTKEPSLIHCMSVLNFTAVLKISIDFLSISRLICDYGLTATGQFFSISNSILSESVGNASAGSVLHLEESNETRLTNMVFQGNRNENERGSGTVFISGKDARVFVENCSFVGNRAKTGAGLVLMSVAEAKVVDSGFVENMAESGSGLDVHLLPEKNSSFWLSSCFFANNSAAHFGSLTFSLNQDITYLFLSLFDLNFTRNQAAIGSAIYSSIGILFQSGSKISHCNVVGNTAGEGGVVHFDGNSGYLELSNIDFYNNTAKNGAAAHLQCFSIISNLTCLLSLSQVNISRNNGESMLDISNFAQIAASNLTCAYSTGVCLQFTTVSFSCAYCRFAHNSAQSSPALHSVSSNVSILFATFIHNSAEHIGGVAVIERNSNFICDSCEFVGNAAAWQGGVLLIRQHSFIRINNSMFGGNFAEDNGFAIAISMCEGLSSIADSVFWNNTGNGSGSIYAISTTISMRNSSIRGNTFGKLTAGLVGQLSNIDISGCAFVSQTSTSGSFLYLVHSTASVDQSRFADGLAHTLGGAIATLDTTLIVKNSYFESLSSQFGGAISLQNGSNLTLESCIFHGISTTTIKKGAVDGLKSWISIANTTFEWYTASAISGRELTLHISNSSFLSKTYIDAQASMGAGVLCLSCTNVEILGSLFRNLSGDVGSAVYLFTGNNVRNSKWKVEACEFQRNSVMTFGTFYVENAFLVMQRNAFLDNVAVGDKSKGAGVVLISDSTHSAPQYELLNNTFVNNSAETAGGAIYWLGSPPILTSNKFSHNSALYGPDVASIAVQLFLNSSLLSSVPSGQACPFAVVLSLLDNYGSTVTSDSASFAQMSVFDPSASLSGVVRVQAHRGLYSFAEFVIIATPGKNTTVAVSSSALPSSAPVLISIAMRECRIGETLNNNLCILCKPGTYSLDPAFSCKNCPSEAVCLGNFTMAPRAGYWRSNPFSDHFFACPNKNACLGSSVSQLNWTGECAEGYEGNKCQNCAKGYFRWGKLTCSNCPSKLVQSITKLAIVCSVSLILVITIKAIVKSASNADSMHFVYVKILVNYLQLVMLLGVFNLNWPELMLKLFYAQEVLGGFPEIVFSSSCLDAGLNEEAEYQLKVILLALAHPIFLATSSLVWSVIALCKKSIKYIRDELVCSAIVLFFLAYPSVVQVMLSVFHCEEIDPGKYWIVGVQAPCWTSTHLKFALGLALPSLIIWGVAVPTVLFLVLKVQRRSLQARDLRVRYWYLIQGYHEEKYYWELVVTFRKLIVILFTVTLSSVSGSFQVLTVLGVLSASIAVQWVHQPFALKVFNDLEKRALVISTLTLYGGLLFSIDILTDRLRLALFVVLAVVNCYFSGMCLKTMAVTGVIMVVRRLEAMVRSRHPQTSDAIDAENREIPQMRVNFFHFFEAIGERTVQIASVGETSGGGPTLPVIRL